MPTTLASQLQAIKSAVKGSADPIRRPATRPSIIFDPKEAADIDLRSLLPIAISGLEVLVTLDARFGRYNNTLFSHTSLELDREKMAPEEEKKLNLSIRSYLRLLSGHLHHPAALKTLEYLIRRYQVHVFNMEELILCSLPYHDTHAFVRIAQLMDFGNKKWAFLEAAKVSGAPPPRKVIVQQCICDKGVLEALCNYASPSEDFQQPRPVINFCTAVIVEALGCIPKLDTDTVQRVLRFVFDGLNSSSRGDRDHKAGALMVVGLLATKAVLSPKLVQNLISRISSAARHDAKQYADLPWLRVTTMSIVSLVQSQSAQMFPKKSILILNEISDFVAVLSGLCQEFNIQKFLHLYVDSQLEYSISEVSCRITLTNILEVLPLKDFVEKIVSKVLLYILELSQNVENSNVLEAGKWAKETLVVTDKHYPCEMRGAVHKFLEHSKMDLGNESTLKTFCLTFEGNLRMPTTISDSEVWFSLEHPKAEVRRATLRNIATPDLLKDMAVSPKNLLNIQEALIRRLYDDELSVVQAAVCIDGLAGIISPPCLLKSYRDILFRCIDILNKCTPGASKASDLAISCLERMVLEFQSHHLVDSKEVATIIFPLLIVHPKSWKVNLKALELAKLVQWPFFHDVSLSCDPISFEQIKNLESSYISSTNMRTIGALSETLEKNPQDHIQWLIECSSQSNLSKSLFLFIILQALMVQNKDSVSMLRLYQASSHGLMHEWEQMESRGSIIPVDELNVEVFSNSCTILVEQLSSSDFEHLNQKIMICIYWRLLKRYVGTNQNTSAETSGHILDELFMFFAKSTSKNVFRKHLNFLVNKCSLAPQFLCKYFAEEGFPLEVQVESLHSFATICSTFPLSKSSVEESYYLQLLLGLPSLLIPLSSENKDIRLAAVSCIEGLHKLWRPLDISRLKNGNTDMLACVSQQTFDDFLQSIIIQKMLISSDVNFLPSYLASMLSPSAPGLLVPEGSHKRYNQSAKDAILRFLLSSALKFSSYGKLKVLSLLKGTGIMMLHVDGVKSLLFELLERLSSTSEIKIACLLLEVCALALTSGHDNHSLAERTLIKALKVDGQSSYNPVVAQPCAAVLEHLTCTLYDNLKIEIQDELFWNLVTLFRNDNGDIRNAAREALLRINITSSTITRLLEFILAQDGHIGSSKKVKRDKALPHRSFGLGQNALIAEDTRLFFLGSLLDILLLKRDIEKRFSLVQPMIQVLEYLFSKDWLARLTDECEKGKGDLFDTPESVTNAVYYAQQRTLLILKDICDSLSLELPLKDDVVNKFNMVLLIDCARSANNVMTRNHVLMLLSSVAMLSSGWVSEHIIDIFTVIGETAVKEIDSHSQHVLEVLISKLVPCWLSKTNGVQKLLQIFINALPEVAEHRRLSLIVYLLRTLGEKSSLGVLVVELFRSLIIRVNISLDRVDHFLPSSTTILKEWEYMFAVQLFNQYSLKIWFPCLVDIFQEVGKQPKRELFSELYLAIQFVIYKLQDTELVFELESGQDVDHLQITLGEVIKQAVLHLQLVSLQSQQLSINTDAVRKLKDCINRVLKTITRWMVSSAFFNVIAQLLGHSEINVKKKTLGLLCETVKGHGSVQKKQKVPRKLKLKSSAFRIDERTTPSFTELCLKIVQLIDSPLDDSDTSVKLLAVSSIETLAKEFPSYDIVFDTCLTCVVKHICSTNLPFSSICLKTTGALINVLGSKALSQLPNIMKNILDRAHEISNYPIGESKHGNKEMRHMHSSYKVSLLVSVFITLEAVIDNLGDFLNPYLENILDLIILHPEYDLEVDMKLKVQTSTVRRLLTQKIPVRLMLTPLMKIFPNAVKCGESSISFTFEMLADMIAAMDRSSISSYHVKLFEHCLVALDLRRQFPDSVKDMNMVEQSVINAMIVLTMKLTETTFRPLFFHSLEWAEAEVEPTETVKSRSLDRIISFYNLVNKLTEQHRSLFVPYFKYLLEGCTRYLTEDQDAHPILLNKKRKKDKVHIVRANKNIVLSHKQWYLRALILKSLYLCFLYDTADLKFLNASNFQDILKPIVSQLAVEPPTMEDTLIDIPSVVEVDESIILCLGQMAITTHSDVLWKPLNHEVLMQTRNENPRPKMLGLKVIKYLVELLKEEYLVFLPETIPFLGELLEDVELPIKTLAQEILKEMETLSGESLRQYL